MEPRTIDSGTPATTLIPFAKLDNCVGGHCGGMLMILQRHAFQKDAKGLNEESSIG